MRVGQGRGPNCRYTRRRGRRQTGVAPKRDSGGKCHWQAAAGLAPLDLGSAASRLPSQLVHNFYMATLSSRPPSPTRLSVEKGGPAVQLAPKRGFRWVSEISARRTCREGRHLGGRPIQESRQRGLRPRREKRGVDKQGLLLARMSGRESAGVRRIAGIARRFPVKCLPPAPAAATLRSRCEAPCKGPWVAPPCSRSSFS